MGDEIVSVVIDNGSGVCKAGMATEEKPHEFPSIVGCHKYMVKIHYQRRNYMGNEAQERRGVLALKYITDENFNTDWDELAKLWYHAYDSELRVNPGEHPLLLSEAAATPKPCREKKTQVWWWNLVMLSATLSQYMTATVCPTPSAAHPCLEEA
uniref:Uncharacterized protein n=1 Tax=Poecilia reticulata TaxID=8081 RepID=A0A3P9PTR3_POERE